MVGTMIGKSLSIEIIGVFVGSPEVFKEIVRYNFALVTDITFSNIAKVVSGFCR